MSKTPKHNVGASISNPVKAVTPTAGEEGTDTPSVAQTPVVGAPTMTNTSSGQASVSGAVGVFETALDAAAGLLEAALPAEPADPPRSVRRMTPSQRQAAPLLALLVKKYPVLSASYTADDISIPMADASATSALSQDLSVVKAKVDYTTRLREATTWKVAGEIYATAEKKALDDPDIARDLAPIQALLATGPRAKTAAHTAVDAEQAAVKATARAGKATAKAAAKATAAAQQETGDAIITTPAPATTAPAATAPAATTPAASTTAPAATPGTPGSVPIR